MNTAYHLEIKPVGSGYTATRARKEPIDLPASKFPELVPLDDPANEGAAFWFVVEGENLTGNEEIFQYFRAGVDPAEVFAVCAEAWDWTKELFVAVSRPEPSDVSLQKGEPEQAPCATSDQSALEHMSPAQLVAAFREVVEHKDAHGLRRNAYIAWLHEAERRGHDWAYDALEEIAIGELHDLHEVEGDWVGGRDSLKIDYAWKPDKAERTMAPAPLSSRKECLPMQEDAQSTDQTAAARDASCWSDALAKLIASRPTPPRKARTKPEAYQLEILDEINKDLEPARELLDQVSGMDLWAVDRLELSAAFLRKALQAFPLDSQGIRLAYALNAADFWNYLSFDVILYCQDPDLDYAWTDEELRERYGMPSDLVEQRKARAVFRRRFGSLSDV